MQTRAPWDAAPKRRDAANRLRHQIVAGQLAAGCRLPNRWALEKSLGVSYITVQRTVDQLVREGFLEVHGRRGTFVTASPPHRHRFGLVFPVPPWADGSASGYYTALHRAALEREGTSDDRFIFYHGIDWQRDPRPVDLLRSDLATRRLAGLIFATPPHSIAKQKNTADILHTPHVAISTQADAASPWPTVALDYGTWLQEALGLAAAHGARRIAVIQHAQRVPPFSEQACRGAVNQRGLSLPDAWFLRVTADGARNIVQLLFPKGANTAPDAILVADDNLAEAVGQGLLAARAPAALTLIVHANLPWPTACPRPAIRLGFDMHSVVAACVAAVREFRPQAPAPVIRIPAVLETPHSAPIVRSEQEVAR